MIRKTFKDISADQCEYIDFFHNDFIILIIQQTIHCDILENQNHILSVSKQSSFPLLINAAALKDFSLMKNCREIPQAIR